MLATCLVCHGAKKIRGIGNIRVECEGCKGTGYQETKPRVDVNKENISPPLVCKRPRGRPKKVNPDNKSSG
jgi:hypothetical protein